MLIVLHRNRSQKGCPKFSLAPYIMSKSLKKILPNFRHYWESWKNLESRLQYVTYNNKKLSNYIDNLEKIVDSIASDNAYIMKYAEIILCSLKNC